MGLNTILPGRGISFSPDTPAPHEDVAGVIARGCRAYPTIGTAAQTEQVRRLLSAGAWTEAALALLRLEAPEWTVRRIELDDGEWFCALSRYPALPAEFDECPEGRHRLLPLAILSALAELKARAAQAPASLQPRSGSDQPALLDNFR